MPHINELATEKESKRGAGRPEIDSEAIFNELLSKPESRKQLCNQIAYLVTERKKLLAKQEQYKEDVKATKEVFGLASSFITKSVDALVKDQTKKKLTEASLFADLLQVLREGIEGEGQDQEDDNEWSDTDDETEVDDED